MFYSDSLKNNNHVKHHFFSRKNGVSKGIYESLNCGIGSKDKKEDVQKNLEIVAKNFKIEKKRLILMNQTHSNKVQIIEKEDNLKRIEADAMLTQNDKVALLFESVVTPGILFSRTEYSVEVPVAPVM